MCCQHERAELEKTKKIKSVSKTNLPVPFGDVLSQSSQSSITGFLSQSSISDDSNSSMHTLKDNIGNFGSGSGSDNKDCSSQWDKVIGNEENETDDEEKVVSEKEKDVISEELEDEVSEEEENKLNFFCKDSRLGDSFEENLSMIYKLRTEQYASQQSDGTAGTHQRFESHPSMYTIIDDFWLINKKKIETAFKNINALESMKKVFKCIVLMFLR
jgi:hypothetical protein